MSRFLNFLAAALAAEIDVVDRKGDVAGDGFG
ncbi:hypothetical protein GGE07_000900 [Sinorhizobium terangae]|nr:hypothetical protein [Sinorhizobium terangae]